VDAPDGGHFGLVVDTGENGKPGFHFIWRDLKPFQFWNTTLIAPWIHDRHRLPGYALDLSFFNDQAVYAFPLQIGIHVSERGDYNA
jgi:hypothetical protein